MHGPTETLHELMNKPGIIAAPGAYDALSARLIERAGFPIVYMTGSGVAASMLAFPDIGLVMLMEMVEQARRIVSAVKIPVISDADTGYGNILNVRRTVKEFESIGISGIHLEDQNWPKKCGHFIGKSLISKDEMIKKIRAAIDARHNPNFIIIARTDAIAVEGFKQAIQRGQEYAKAGADMIFLDAPISIDQIKQIPSHFDIPVMINMDFCKKTPWFSQQELAQVGYKIVIYPGLPQLTALKASREILGELFASGTIKEINAHQDSFDDFLSLTNLDELTSWEAKYDI